jgi:DNA-binding NtrC family response regulator
MSKKILLIEDDDRLRRILQLVLTDAGYDVHTAADGREGISAWSAYNPKVVVTDLKMEPLDGLAVLNWGQIHAPQVPIIILTAFGTVETAVSAMKNGAFDYLTKPVDNDELLDVIRDALTEEKTEATGEEALLGNSEALKKIESSIRLFASTDSSVLITGESGTGKELAARAIHRLSPMADGPFIRVNCAAIPRELMESELFGHTKGAFTSAVNDRKGAFQQAHEGTLFLDEIGDLPLELQPKLLHAVEEKTVVPVGSGNEHPVNVKILSATNQNLEHMIADKTFRRDLYYRLNTVHLHMPPVRDRPDDLELYLEHFLKLYSRKFDRPQPAISESARTLLRAYSWPGNVREIRNVMERAVLTCRSEVITPELLPSALHQSEEKTEVKTALLSTDLLQQERALITKVLHDCDWNQSKAARELGISRNTLRYRIKKYGISKT